MRECYYRAYEYPPSNMRQEGKTPCEDAMNGAETLMMTARDLGIEVCFANPGTTEIPLVAALDTVAGIRPVLCLFEGVCTGAADGYARMTGRPAMALLHLGPGLANGLANLHNARRARTPAVVVVGEHALWHRPLDPPLAMDIESLASTAAGWQRTCGSAGSLGQDMADALHAALQGQTAVLVVPFDLQTEETATGPASLSPDQPAAAEKDLVIGAARLVREAARPALVLGGWALSREGLLAAARVRSACGCGLLAEAFPARMERGAGLPDVPRIPYLPEMARAVLDPYDVLVFAGAGEPVAFFGYRNGPGKLLRDDQRRVHLAGPRMDAAAALGSLAEALRAPEALPGDRRDIPRRPDLPAGPLSGDRACAVTAALQPAGAIVVDESITNSLWYYPLTAGAPPFTLLTLTGGSLGFGPACATGAALACPARPVINLQADGSAMYTVQSLWTQAREGLNVTTLIFANRRYDILRLELARAGITSPGAAALRFTDLPGIDWAGLGRSLGVASTAVDTAEDLALEMARAFDEPGPHLIQMNI